MGTRAETSRKEKAILKFIENQVIENGYPPSVREIGKAIGLSSTATVHAYLAKLEKQGYIKKEDKKIGNKVIILDDITDPGNLGTIIRSAVAFNFDTVILSNNTTDLYNPKVIRATEGMLFNINIIRDNLLNIIPKLKEEKYFILGTKVTNGKDITKYRNINKIALIMGNETRGMNRDLDNLCDDYIYIKMNNKCESLNVGVSASILMYELNK